MFIFLSYGTSYGCRGLSLVLAGSALASLTAEAKIRPMRTFPWTRYAEDNLLPERSWRLASDQKMGVFANRAYAQGEVIEMCAVRRWNPLLAEDPVAKWFFRAEGKGGDSVVDEAEIREASARAEGAQDLLILPLGWCLLYNEVPAESGKPNVRWEYNEHSDQAMRLVANRDVTPGEELCVARGFDGNHSGLRDIIGTEHKFLAKKRNMQPPSDPGMETPAGGFVPVSPAEITMKPMPTGDLKPVAARSIPKDTIVLVEPYLVMKWAHVVNSDVTNDIFWSSWDDELVVLLLGLGTNFGHCTPPALSYEDGTPPNAPFQQKFRFSFITTRNVSAGEELCLDFGEDYFKSRESADSVAETTSVPADRYNETHPVQKEWRLANDWKLGVFASRDYDFNEVVESCYSLEITGTDMHFEQWLFQPEGDGAMPLLPFGWCMLYNEVTATNSAPNMKWVDVKRTDAKGKERHFLQLHTLRHIAKGEELCVARHSSGATAGDPGLRDFITTNNRQEAKENLVEPPLDNSPRPTIDLRNGIHVPHSPWEVEARFSEVDGVGIFALKDFKSNEVVTSDPYFIAPWSFGENQGISVTNLNAYVFWTTFSDNLTACLLGLSSIFNHNTTPNVRYQDTVGPGSAWGHRFLFSMITTRPISAGEELFINYGDEYWSSRSENSGLSPSSEKLAAEEL